MNKLIGKKVYYWNGDENGYQLYEIFKVTKTTFWLKNKDHPKIIAFKHGIIATGVMDWFDNCYVEDHKLILDLIQQTIIKSACTAEGLFKACLQLHMHDEDEKNHLQNDIKYFKKLANVGISGSRAGEMLRSYFIVSRVINR